MGNTLPSTCTVHAWSHMCQSSTSKSKSHNLYSQSNTSEVDWWKSKSIIMHMTLTVLAIQCPNRHDLHVDMIHVHARDCTHSMNMFQLGSIRVKSEEHQCTTRSGPGRERHVFGSTHHHIPLCVSTWCERAHSHTECSNILVKLN